jgi:hypothetical protein
MAREPADPGETNQPAEREAAEAGEVDLIVEAIEQHRRQ